MKKMQKVLVGATVVGSILGGGALGVTLVGAATAATPSPSPSASTGRATSTPDATDPAGTAETAEPAEGAESAAAESAEPQHDPSKGGHTANGVTEAVLTGDTATKVSDAVLAANPGATIQRLENDAEGATYEAHISKADGTKATVKLDAAFAVTATESGR